MTSRRRLREERQALDRELVRRYKAGEGIVALAAEQGMHAKTVKSRLRAAGVTLRSYSSMTTADIDRAELLYEQGMGLKKIAREFGVGHTTIWRHLRTRGVEMRPMRP